MAGTMTAKQWTCLQTAEAHKVLELGGPDDSGISPYVVRACLDKGWLERTFICKLRVEAYVLSRAGKLALAQGQLKNGVYRIDLKELKGQKKPLSLD